MSEPNNIIDLDTTLSASRLHYLKSANFGDSNDDSANDDTTTCVLTPAADQQTFTASVLRVNAFTRSVNLTTGRLDVYGVAANGAVQTNRRLARAGLTASGLTRQSVNYTYLLRGPLRSVNFTYTKGENDLSFLMRIQGTSFYILLSNSNVFYFTCVHKVLFGQWRVLKPKLSGHVRPHVLCVLVGNTELKICCRDVSEIHVCHANIHGM